MPEFYLLNYILVGDSAVGKSSLLHSLMNKEVKNEHSATVGLEFGTLKIKHQDKRFKFIIWDTAGQERYYSIVRLYFKSALGALLVYDITNLFMTYLSRKSFLNLEKWVNDIKDYGSEKVSVFLIGNKTDLEANREVSKVEGEEFAKKHNLGGFIETSAVERFNVETAFFETFKLIYGKIENGIIPVSPKLEEKTIVSAEIEQQNVAQKDRCAC